VVGIHGPGWTMDGRVRKRPDQHVFQDYITKLLLGSVVEGSKISYCKASLSSPCCCTTHETLLHETNPWTHIRLPEWLSSITLDMSGVNLARAAGLFALFGQLWALPQHDGSNNDSGCS
jgi:hypothetical protein